MIIAAAESGTNPLVSFLPLILIFAVFYFLMIRPQNKRRREQLQMQSSVEPGSRVLTTNGMHATVVEVDDDGLVLEIAPGVEVRFVRQAVMQVLTDDDLESEESDESDDAADSAVEAVDADETTVNKADETVTDEADEATGAEPKPGAKSLAKSGQAAEKASERPSA